MIKMYIALHKNSKQNDNKWIRQQPESTANTSRSIASALINGETKNWENLHKTLVKIDIRKFIKIDKTSLFSKHFKKEKNARFPSKTFPNCEALHFR